jgi:hypothetical protein
MTRKSTLFTLVFALFAFVQGAWADITLEGKGTADEPYLIKNLSDWNTFANLVNQEDHFFENEYVKLTNQIENITTSVGVGRSFKGTFDGGGHGLVLDFGEATFSRAPFGSVENATIKNVQVGAKASSEYSPFGEIIVEDNGSALVGVAKGTTRIENVQIWNNVGIRIKPSLGSTQRHLGGLVGYADYGSLTLKDVKFIGEFMPCKDENGIACEYNSVGGLVGEINKGVTLTLDNCIFRGNFLGTGDFHPISTYIGEVQTGAISINSDHSRATINGAYTGSEKASIPGEITVNEVVLNRTFTPGAFSTIVLPFSIELDKVSGAKFYGLSQMSYENGKWTAGATPVSGRLEADTPYLVNPSAATITFDGSVTLKTTENPVTTTNGWKFRGAYGRVNFGDSSETILGRAYGFVAKDTVINGTQWSVGQFAKAGSKAYIPPMRAYLVYNEANGAAKDAGGLGLGGAAALPDVIEVKIMDEQGKVTETVVLNPATGAISKDRWFDVQGRQLKAKPAIKGRYLHNGKIEVVK